MAVIDPLDFESAREYFLSILATDGGTPPLSNTAIVKVNVTDANDNAPVFGMTVYHAEVLEDAEVGHNILQVNEGISHTLKIIRQLIQVVQNRNQRFC